MLTVIKVFLVFTFILLAHPMKAQEDKSISNIVGKMVSEIDTAVDTRYIYEYESAKYVPPSNKTLLILGQTKERITEWVATFPYLEDPAGWSSYWGIPEFKGVASAHRQETGSTQDHQMIIDSFPHSILHSALWMVGHWDVAKNTGKGKYDKVVRQFANWAKTVDRPIFLRIGYEFDGPHNTLEPKQYVKAYRRIVDLLREEDVDNIAYVWHSYASTPFKNYALSDWYPGDEYVDWFAISVFGHAYGGTDFGIDCDNVLNLAKQHKKPVMIAESSPIKGVDTNDTGVWNEWFAHLFSFAYNKNIKAISFINEDWTKLNIPGIEQWKDSRINNNYLVSLAWSKETSKSRYLKASPDLFSALGYE